MRLLLSSGTRGGDLSPAVRRSTLAYLTFSPGLNRPLSLPLYVCALSQRKGIGFLLCRRRLMRKVGPTLGIISISCLLWRWQNVHLTYISLILGLVLPISKTHAIYCATYDVYLLVFKFTLYILSYLECLLSFEKCIGYNVLLIKSIYPFA